MFGFNVISTFTATLYLNFCVQNVLISSFNAKELDSESGLNYFEACYQDPKFQGVFISHDQLFKEFT